MNVKARKSSRVLLTQRVSLFVTVKMFDPKNLKSHLN
jgi:hypothetical protein